MILFAAVVAAVSCGAGVFVHMYQEIATQSQQINSLQKQVNDSLHSCAQLNEDGLRTDTNATPSAECVHVIRSYI